MKHEEYIKTLEKEIEDTISEIETFRDMGKRHEVSVCEQKLVQKITILGFLSAKILDSQNKDTRTLRIQEQK